MPALPDFGVDYPTTTMATPDTNSLDVITGFVDTFLQQDSCFPQLVDTLKLSQGKQNFR